jgi:hypothetical protein
MSETKKEMAKVEGDVHIGMRDCGTPVVWFGVEMLVGGALIVMDWDTAKEHIKKAGVYDIKELSNSSCIVTNEGIGGRVRFVEFRR